MLEMSTFVYDHCACKLVNFLPIFLDQCERGLLTNRHFDECVHYHIFKFRIFRTFCIRTFLVRTFLAAPSEVLEVSFTNLLLFEIRVEEEDSGCSGQLLGQVLDCRKSRVAGGRQVEASSGFGRLPV